MNRGDTRLHGRPTRKNDASANVDRDPDEWVSGDDPMTASGNRHSGSRPG
ncbi:DUF3072 domain-containing protein [Mesorhizobium sp. B2-5-4]|nr:DUF3072 domain-containing protein [Mesorhizobium sp. B2-5-13]TPK44772.1 DUF3072 domain-containing protein [Mesorhizobium sp. B2-5-4]TPK52304.1 DUF3072 domain-containing protein [Mesorhizobium sp. B2-5-5]